MYNLVNLSLPIRDNKSVGYIPRTNFDLSEHMDIHNFEGYFQILLRKVVPTYFPTSRV